MGLRDALRRAAVSRPGVLLVGLPGSTAIRLEVETELRRRAWPVMDGLATADLVVVVGSPGPTDTNWLDSVWRQVPSPRALVTLSRVEHVRGELEAGAALLADGGQELLPVETEGEPAAEPQSASEAEGHHGHEQWQEPTPPDHHHMHDDRQPSPPPEQHGPQDTAHGPAGQDADGTDAEHDAHRRHEGHHEQHADPDESTEHQGHDDHEHHEGHAGHQDHSTDHGHAGHDMGEMTVAGLPMAERADDRDGLRLDLLHIPLGPALTDWPCGLILCLSLQGDLVQDADVEYVHVRSSQEPFWSAPWLRASRGEHVTRDSAARRRCGAHLDSLGRFLAVTGWGDLAARSRRLRDGVLTGAPAEQLRPELLKLVRRVERSRALRWLTTGLGPLPADRADELGVSGPARTADGDAYDRARVWLEETRRTVDEFGDARPLSPDDLTGPRGRVDSPRPPSRSLLDALPELLHGVEFAAARVIVASLDPDVDELADVPIHGASHG